MDGSIQALDKRTGDKIWDSKLNLPMIGSVEYESKEQENLDAFVPLVDGSLIRFDKEGYL